MRSGSFILILMAVIFFAALCVLVLGWNRRADPTKDHSIEEHHIQRMENGEWLHITPDITSGLFGGHKRRVVSFREASGKQTSLTFSWRDEISISNDIKPSDTKAIVKIQYRMRFGMKTNKFGMKVEPIK